MSMRGLISLQAKTDKTNLNFPLTTNVLVCFMHPEGLISSAKVSYMKFSIP